MKQLSEVPTGPLVIQIQIQAVWIEWTFKLPDNWGEVIGFLEGGAVDLGHDSAALLPAALTPSESEDKDLLVRLTPAMKL